MAGSNKRGGWSNPASAANGAAGGRIPTSATLRNGDGVFITHVAPDGNTDLGRGRIEVRKADRGARLIVIPQEDGSEIRILVIS